MKYSKNRERIVIFVKFELKFLERFDKDWGLKYFYLVGIYEIKFGEEIFVNFEKFIFVLFCNCFKFLFYFEENKIWNCSLYVWFI